MLDNEYEVPVLIGHHYASHGMGEHIRCSFRALKSAGLTALIHGAYSMDCQPNHDFNNELEKFIVNQLSSNINIFHVNGAGVEQILEIVREEVSNNAYNIIYPTWELSIYPQEWAEKLSLFDEIWAPSRFVFDSISKAVDKPVFHMPLAVTVKLNKFLGRRYFDLPESSYLFLFSFDFNSYIDRKNPFAVIEAFEKVCEARPGADIRLVLKLTRDEFSSEGNKGLPRLTNEIDRCQYGNRIIIIDKIFSDNEIKNLLRCCDCYISLHRSEGFGRSLPESMIMGKPVIGTAYSGNLDFMNEKNSCLVKYKLINIENGQYPFAEGQVWAEPDVDHAVFHMLKLLDNRDYGRKLGEKASFHIRTYFSYRAIGLRYKERLEEIISFRGISTGPVDCQ